ncbi:MAG: 30S ribosomal protein S14 [Candidatus Xenolissoclinum pacificiensis L6]|uniref:Small ribosomal subunit protein uS14 n=1 Tax=Candidatus Xenolissoclinum pacificiensis L6 TaxID=1401685 RepID=W2V0Y8_9RICK|nr:MAG: 30S ribosomal protein S14 [Candidatus Xenolissoclinum pacificiensis L6]
MARKSFIARNVKRINLSAVASKKRSRIRNMRNDKTISLANRMRIQLLLNKMPRDTSRVRVRNRCSVTFRARGYNRYTGVSRIVMRKLLHAGCLPGMKKASW